MEKYGFIYIWYDRKHKRYYVGAHWGNLNDGYICSSGWMNRAFKIRPQDFKRRILKNDIKNKDSLFEEEHKWLNLIKKDELGKRYYNLRNHHFKHWNVSDEYKNFSIKQKISQKTKEAMQRSDVREKYIDGLSKRDNGSSRPDVREKRSNTMKKMGRNKGKITVKDKDGNIFHTTKNDPMWISGELVAASKGVSRPNLSQDHKNKIKETTIFKNLNTMKIKCTYCDFIGNKGNLARYHNDKCKQKIICD